VGDVTVMRETVQMHLHMQGKFHLAHLALTVLIILCNTPHKYSCHTILIMCTRQHIYMDVYAVRYLYLLWDHNLHNAKNNLFFLVSSLQEDPDK